MLVLGGWLLICFGVAGIGGLATAEGVRSWYPGLDTPPWTPPNAAFGPIWTILYAAMAVAAWDITRRPEAPRARLLGAFGAQLALNLAWSPIFFAWHLTGLALVVLTVLWGAVALCIAWFWPHSRLAAGLLVPYLAWLTVAWSLNAWVWWFNP